MPKTITLRVSEEVYKQLVELSAAEDRPISNFILHYMKMAMERMVPAKSSLTETPALKQKDI